MELRESAAGLRWAIGRAGAMAVIWVQIAKTAERAGGRTEPDLHLMKQVEQVTKSALEGPTWRFARIPNMGVTDSVEILVFLIWQLLHWLLFGCKNSQNIQKRPGDLFANGQSGNAAGPNRRFHEPDHMGCRAVAPPNSVRLIHNLGNLACCPDFQSESLPARGGVDLRRGRMCALKGRNAVLCSRSPLGRQGPIGSICPVNRRTSQQLDSAQPRPRQAPLGIGRRQGSG